jgi:putative DNA primase/helicase
MIKQQQATITYATRYLDAGFSIVPLRCDGTKAPAVSRWKEFQERRPTQYELDEWFSKSAGIGLVCGAISNGLEVIDFDMRELLWPLLSMLDSSLKDRLTIIETPSGWHLAYRCSEIAGNTKLAMWEHSYQADRRVRIETRGQGGYVVCEGSPLSTHKSGLPYVHYMGPSLFEVETIAPTERASIWLAAASFDCGIDHEAEARRRGQQRAKQERYGNSTTVGDGTEPWDWFDRFGSWEEILVPHGWRSCGEGRWTRPGKRFGVSAAVGPNDQGIEVLTVFSTSSELRGSLGKFNALCTLHFAGDRKAACRHVRSMMGG